MLSVLSKVLPFLVAFGSVYYLIYLLRPIAFKIGLVDVPGGRKKHVGNKALVGGISIFIAFVLGLLLVNQSLKGFRFFLLGSGLLVMLGMLDDMHEISAKKRIIGQFLIAGIVLFDGGIILHQLGYLITSKGVGTYYLAIPISIFGIVVLINAINMSDGQDGLCGGVALIQVVALAVLCWRGHDTSDLQVLLVLASVLLAFLCFNFPMFNRVANIFLGDAGSTWLGLVFGYFCIKLSQGHQAVAPPVVFVWIMAMPLLDLATSFVRRASRGSSPLDPDRGHLHHLLQDLGLRSFASSSLICILSALFSALGVLGMIYRIPENYMFFAFLLLFVVYFVVVFGLGRHIRSIKARGVIE